MNAVLPLLHLAVTAAKLCRPGGVRAVIAENLLLKQQPNVLRRPRQRAPNLTTTDRLLCGFGSLFLRPPRLRKGSPSVSGPRPCWHFIEHWSIGNTGAYSRPAIVRGRPDRRDRARHSSERSSSSRPAILASAVRELPARLPVHLRSRYCACVKGRASVSAASMGRSKAAPTSRNHWVTTRSNKLTTQGLGHLAKPATY